MSGTSLVADTNVILYLLNGDNYIADLLTDTQVCLSFVTELELLSFKSLTAKEQKYIEEFLSECSVIDISPAIKQTAILFRKKYNLKLPDAIIAPTASFLNLPLLTADKTFKKLNDIDIILIEKE